MSSIVPSPPVAPDADATTRGVVNPTAADQTLGVGTAIHRFANLATSALATLQSVLTNLVRATGAALVLRSDVGANASDIAVKVGTSVTDGSVNSSAKILSARTGLGGTEVEYAYLQKGGFYVVPPLYVSRDLRATAGFGIRFIDNYMEFETNSTVAAATTRIRINNFGAAVWIITGSGRVDQSGTDKSDEPGAATINKPTGKSAIASGATSVVITNSLVAAGDQVHITWHGDLGTQSKIPWVTTAAGSFTVNVGTAPGSAVSFCWSVSKRI